MLLSIDTLLVISHLYTIENAQFLSLNKSISNINFNLSIQFLIYFQKSIFEGFLSTRKNNVESEKSALFKLFGLFNLPNNFTRKRI